MSKLSLPTSPARVAGVPLAGWTGDPRENGKRGAALPCRDRETEEEHGLTCLCLTRLDGAGLSCMGTGGMDPPQHPDLTLGDYLDGLCQSL